MEHTNSGCPDCQGGQLCANCLDVISSRYGD